MKRTHLSLLLLLLAAGLMVGCSPVIQTTVAAVPTETNVPPTSTTRPTLPPPTPTSTPEPTPTVTQPVVATLAAVVGVENLNLRSGPGTIYAILASYPEDTQLTVTARVPGDEWVRVVMADGKTGWMSASLLGLGEEVAYLPLEEVTESIVVTGRVIDSDARPIDGVTVAVLQRLTNDTLRTDALTAQDGYWYAYIPKESAGIWEVQIVGVDCASWIHDQNCNIAGHYLYNYRFIFEVPPISPFLFLYQVADAYITGTVTDADDKPVSMRVFAERADGAYIYVNSDEAGQFTLPVSPGTWSVYAMQYNPNLEGERVEVLVKEGVDSSPIRIKSPVKED